MKTDARKPASRNHAEKTFYIENLGCAKNQVDAEVMIASLKRAGWQYVPETPDQADMIIVNTCGFIKSAQEEAVNTLLGAAKEHPGKKIVAAGCLAQRWADELPDLIPELDGVFGNRAPHRVVETVDAVMDGEHPVFLPDGVDRGEERQDFFGFDRSVYVKIADGCNHGCRYCAIPLIKGKLVSRPADEIVDEVDKLLDQGLFELNFVAQDLAAYGLDRGEKNGSGLLDLLKRILERRADRRADMRADKGVDRRVDTLANQGADSPDSQDFWIRLLYLHPDDFPRELLSLMKSDSRLLPYLDIPFQHASLPVLRKMGRTGSREAYLDLIQEIRETLPQSVIRSTFLVGHPGEGRREFDELLRFQAEAQLDWLGTFAWSREEGTAAAHDKSVFAARMGARTAIKRRKVIEAAQLDITGERLERWVGRDFDMLVEENVEGEPIVLGRSYLQAPDVDGTVVLHDEDATPGSVVRARIIGKTGVDLQAERSPESLTPKNASKNTQGAG